MQENRQTKLADKKTDAYTRVFALIAFLALLVTDRILNWYTPPLESYYMGAAGAVALFGTTVVERILGRFIK